MDKSDLSKLVKKAGLRIRRGGLPCSHMRKYIVGVILSASVLAIPVFTQATALTTAQSTSLIAVVQSSPGVPASAFVNLITAFSNITTNQATSLIAVVQASPSTAASAFVNLLTSFTDDTATTQAATPATTQSSTSAASPTATTQPTTPAIPPTSTELSNTSTNASSTAPTIPTTVVPTTVPPPALVPIPTPQSQPTSIVQDGFDTYNIGMLQGQGGWSNYTNGSNFVVVDTEAFGGTKAIYNQTKADSVITKTGPLLLDGKQTVYVKTASRASWGIHSDGNFQVRVSKNPWASGAQGLAFAAVSFKGDGNVTYYDSVADTYKNFATYEDGVWTSLDIEWRSSDKTARYRINNRSWTDWYTFRNASAFTGFDNVGFDFDLRDGYGGGVYFDSLQ